MPHFWQLKRHLNDNPDCHLEISPCHPSNVPCPLPRRTEQGHASMACASLQNTDYDQEPIEQALRQGEGDPYRSSPWACREVCRKAGCRKSARPVAAFLDDELLDVDAIEERAALAADSVPACYLDAWADRREMATWATRSARRRLNFLQDCRRQILVSDRDGTVKSMKAVANAKAIGRRRKLQQW